MILTLGATSVDIGYAQYPAQINTELVQASERSSSGIPYTEDFSVKLGTTTYSFIDMDLTEYRLLMEFFVNTAEGRLYEFTLTDDRGLNSTVKFTSSTLPFSETFLNLYSGSFTVEETL